MSFDEWQTIAVEELVNEGILEKPLDGNHGNIHPRGTDFVKRGVPFIMASDLENGAVNYKDCKYISEDQARSLKKGFSKEGDILISHKATIGRTALVSNIPYEFLVLTPQVTYYRVKDKSKLSNRYLKYYFDSPDFQATLNAWAGGGSTRAYLGITEQRKLPVKIPSIGIQRQIASILSSLDDKIELNRQTNQTLVAIAHALFKEWFVDFNFPRATGEMQDSGLGKIPKGWTVGRLGDILNFKNGKSSPEKSDSFAFPVYGANGIIGFSEVFNSNPKSIVIGRVGSFCGAVYYTIENSFVTENAIIAETKNETYSMFSFLSMQRLNLNAFKVGSGQPLLNQSIISGLQIIIPSIDLVQEFEAVSFSIFNQIFHNEKQNETLIQLRDTLLPKLMKGEISVIQPEQLSTAAI